ncbi:glycosyltransferase family 39 protein [Methanosphaera sp.]
MINKIHKSIKENKIDLYYILFIICILLIISIPKLLNQYTLGISNWDTYLYLENARTFSKMGWGDVQSIAPVLPMIISKFFIIAGHPYEEIIFNLDVFFYILGVVSLYLILRFKFDKNTSLVGSLIYATFTLIYSWVAIGGNDIIGVTGTLLTVYIVLVAHKYNTKFYYLAIPIAAYAFLSRYTAGVMIFPLIFYIIINRVNLNEIKDIIIGGVLGVVSISWFLNQFNKVLGTPFPFLDQFSGTVSNVQVIDSGYMPDTWYYITHIPNYLSSVVPPKSTFNAIVNPMGNIPTLLAYVYIILMILGIILIFYNMYHNIRTSDIKFRNKKNNTLIAIGIIIGLICLLTINQTSYIITIILFLIVMGIIWLLGNKYNIKHSDYDLLMISLFVVYLVFQSILSTKNDRYFITVLPFIAYFITCTISNIYKYIDSKFTFKKIKLSTLVSIIIVIFLILNSLVFLSQIPQANHYRDVEDSCEWLVENYPEIDNTTIIYSDNWPAVTWYTNIYVQRGVPDLYSENGSQLFSEEILSQNSTHHAASLYIDTNSFKKLDYPGLTIVKEIGDVTIYENSYQLGSHEKDFDSESYKNYINETLEFNKRGL